MIRRFEDGADRPGHRNRVHDVVEKLKELPPKCRTGDNKLAFEGGFRLWQDDSLIV